MTEHPILFSGQIVRAILEGRKTVMRLINKPRSPYKRFRPGHRLWVKETWRKDMNGSVKYRADQNPDTDGFVWHLSIYMSRMASRITLEIRSIGCECLHAITEDDAVREGVAPDAAPNAMTEFRDLWNTLNGAGSWASNPDVWRIQFKVMTP